MKTFLLTISLAGYMALSMAQTGVGQPVMTTEFSDSLKHGVQKLIHRDYSIKFLYRSPLSADGKLSDPKILKEMILDDENDHGSLELKLRALILNMPAWKPADDKAFNPTDVAMFYIIIANGKIDIGTDPTGKFNRQ